VRLLLKVAPKSSRDRIVGWLGERLKLSVRAAPERGRANEAVVALLAESLALPRAAVRVVAGHGAPEKAVEVDAPEAVVRARLPARSADADALCSRSRGEARRPRDGAGARSRKRRTEESDGDPGRRQASRADAQDDGQ